MFEHETFEELRANCRACVISAKVWRTSHRMTAAHYIAKGKLLRGKMQQRYLELGRMG